MSDGEKMELEIDEVLDEETVDELSRDNEDIKPKLGMKRKKHFDMRIVDMCEDVELKAIKAAQHPKQNN
ncbi:MAG: hypothetical protein LBB45_05005 [Methanobrevibacter sp.]|jgi:hypothetical protein|nr:hypothetical protein [Candidatus Methanovirga basalitermitum]